MPKLTSITFKRTSPAGEVREFRADIHVSSDGIFAAVVPDDVADTVRELAAKGVLEDSIEVIRPRQHARVTGASLEVVKAAVNAALTELLAVETTVERVIVYSHRVDVSAWENRDGSLSANGYIGDPREEGGNWHPMGDHLHALSRTSHFQVGLYAEVFDMVIHRRPNSERVEFRKPEWGHHHLSYPTWGSKLNGFGSLKRPAKPEDLPRLPYTEEGARYFYEMLMALCYLGRNLHEFFSDQNQVKGAIERGAVPLLAQIRKEEGSDHAV